MDTLDWTEGILIKQTRVSPLPRGQCDTRTLDATCFKELVSGAYEAAGVDPVSQAPFGFNWTMYFYSIRKELRINIPCWA